MIDVQNQPDDRQVEIQKVGVKNIRYPITVLDKANGVQHTVANVNMYVNLPHHFKGTHMSRFIEILNTYKGDIAIKNFADILQEMKETLKAKSAHLEIEFPYFIEKQAPVTHAQGLMEYICRFCGNSNEGAEDDFYVGIDVPITTVCPCSKEISDQGAHNQRGTVTVNVRFNKFIWIEDIIQLVEESASCDVYSIRKPHVRGGRGAGGGAKTRSRPQYHLVLRGVGELREHPQPQRLRVCGEVISNPSIIF
jgi:GTP cyclohydrolase I